MSVETTAGAIAAAFVAGWLARGRLGGGRSRKFLLIVRHEREGGKDGEGDEE